MICVIQNLIDAKILILTQKKKQGRFSIFVEFFDIFSRTCEEKILVEIQNVVNFCKHGTHGL